MIKQFRFHSKDFSKDLTLAPDNDWLRDELADFLKNLDTEYPSLNSVKDFADRTDIRNQEGITT